MSKKKDRDFEDDNRVVADMSDVHHPSFFGVSNWMRLREEREEREPKKHPEQIDPAAQDNRELEPMSNEDTRHYVGQAMLGTLAICGVYIAGAALVILLIFLFW